MKVSEFKKIADTLARFATTRETAKPPESLIGVQSRDGALRLIAGESTAGVVVPVEGAIIRENAAFTINARTFLQASKVLPAKSSVEIAVDAHKLVITAEGGGVIELEDIGTIKLAGFAKKPREFVASAQVKGPDWKRLANLFKSVSEKVMVPSIQIVGDVAYATAVSSGVHARYVSLDLYGAEGPDSYNMAAYREFWEGLFSFTEDGTIQWGKSGVLATSGQSECFSAPYLVSKYDSKTRTSELPREVEAWPILRIAGELSSGFSAVRRDLITVVRGQSPFDKLNRITLEVDTDFVRVSPFGSETGQKFQTPTFGRGIRSVNADYLMGFLSNMDSKEVTLRWGDPSRAISITGQGYEDWTILLAPVGL